MNAEKLLQIIENRLIDTILCIVIRTSVLSIVV